MVGLRFLFIVKITFVHSMKHKKMPKKAIKHFMEGWIGFESKKIAKLIAGTINNTKVFMRKKSKFYNVMSNIKHFPR